MSNPAGIKSMKLRPGIGALFGVIALSAISASASAAPISTMSGLARNEAVVITKIAQRHHYASQARNRNKGGSRNQNRNLDPPFGSAGWWDQMGGGNG